MSKPLLINALLSVLADISLADWGRKALTLAENEMPGLMHLRNTKITLFAIPSCGSDPAFHFNADSDPAPAPWF
jgi:hypothetical protein